MPLGNLGSVDVIAQTSFEVTNQICTHEWKDHGVKLHVPQDILLSTNLQRCRVKMSASLSGQYTFPAGCKPVSGVYWMHCPVELSEYVTLEMQHCGSSEEELHFVRVECTWEALPYAFQKVEGGVFSEHSSQIRVSLPKFSGWAVVQKRSDTQQLHDQQPERQEYEAQVYYMNPAVNTWHVLFAIRCRKGVDLEDKVCVNDYDTYKVHLSFTSFRNEIMYRYFAADWRLLQGIRFLGSALVSLWNLLLRASNWRYQILSLVGC